MKRHFSDISTVSMASNEKKRLEAIADHLALQASQEPQDEFIMDLVSTPEGIVVNTNEAVDFFKASAASRTSSK